MTLGEDEEPKVNEYAYTHPEYESLSYHIFSSLDTTPHGELYLYQLVPTNERTTEVFEDLARRSGTRAHRLAPWPEKLMLD